MSVMIEVGIEAEQYCMKRNIFGEFDCTALSYITIDKTISGDYLVSQTRGSVGPYSAVGVKAQYHPLWSRHPLKQWSLLTKGVQSMTTCVAALCDDRKAIVLAADKMISLSYVEYEPDISKIYEIHPHWRMMVAGNNIEPAFDMISMIRDKLASTPEPLVEMVMSCVTEVYQNKRQDDAEAIYLKPRGWDLEGFRRDGYKYLGDGEASVISQAMSDYEYQMQLLIVGFDQSGPNGSYKGHIFSVSGSPYIVRGIAQRHDLGFYAIGSGNTNALFIMSYRKVTPSMGIKEAAYYTLEGKYYGEKASMVGPDTDVVIMRPAKLDIRVHDDNTEILINKICQHIEPSDLRDSDVRILNSVPELQDLPDMVLPSIKKKKEKEDHKARTMWAKGKPKKKSERE